ncbi:hypothetical protein IQE94_11660 [Synechocystis sp. PCC 7339]|uniref:hypothetical protein n=1 Tax=Synechocystis sp. PCC 7339 TaxID=2782213 RepID=UPI001CBC961B|nr:hypothetical protein [Synechocystis sp. PCC 7339]UAJ71789.1 hypothetical protein IQE94_11660 [Synechocystis sp. PCC 7339]
MIQLRDRFVFSTRSIIYDTHQLVLKNYAPFDKQRPHLISLSINSQNEVMIYLTNLYEQLSAFRQAKYGEFIQVSCYSSGSGFCLKSYFPKIKGIDQLIKLTLSNNDTGVFPLTKLKQALIEFKLERKSSF